MFGQTGRPRHDGDRAAAPVPRRTGSLPLACARGDRVFRAHRDVSIVTSDAATDLVSIDGSGPRACHVRASAWTRRCARMTSTTLVFHTPAAGEPAAGARRCVAAAPVTPAHRLPVAAAGRARRPGARPARALRPGGPVRS